MTHRSLLLVVASTFASLAAGCAPGGCPWVDTSPVTVTPDAGCLSVRVPSGDAADATGGCVDPVLTGENRCDAALTLPATLTADHRAHEVAPGAPFAIEISLAAGRLDEGTGRYAFAVPARLGDASLTLAFEAMEP